MIEKLKKSENIKLKNVTLKDFHESQKFCVCLLSLDSFIDLSPQFIITMMNIRKVILLLYGYFTYLYK